MLSKTYTTFNPINLVEKWNTPILIIQGKDFVKFNRPRPRSFQAAQLRGIKVDLYFRRKPLGSETTNAQV
jgi:dipeptidyl aminopeptidase/acylaminoacyl peptidase